MSALPPSCLVVEPFAHLASASINALKSLKLEVLPPAFDGISALNIIVYRKPLLAILGDELPDLNSFGILEYLLEHPEPTRVIIHSRDCEPAYALQSLLLGARGCLHYGATPDEFDACIWSVSRGGMYLSPVLLESVMTLMRQLLANRPDPYRHLSHREREVMLLIARGLTTAEIANNLKPQVSSKTVETHRENLRTKLGITGGGSALLKAALSYLEWLNQRKALNISGVRYEVSRHEFQNPEKKSGFFPD